ncbi:MAG: hypothetical protein IMF00_06115 [Proteobacteria bacterium]|nr:hypothetical protein [Pseudomonadota bacterium]
MKKEYYTTSLQHILAELERIDLLIQVQVRRARDRFSSEFPLFKYYLLHLFDDPSHQNPPLLSKYLRVDERVVNYLFGSDEIDIRLQTCARLNVPQTCYPGYPKGVPEDGQGDDGKGLRGIRGTYGA